MATAAAILRRALRTIGAIAGGETPSATEQADGLEALNAMLDSWRTESLSVYAVADESFTLTGADSYVSTAAARPVRIEAAYHRIDDTDYPLRLASSDAWARLLAKGTTGTVAEWLYYEPTHPQGTIRLYPNPPSGVLHLVTWVPLISYAATDDVSLPPGYQDAITYNLAVRLSPEYSRPVTPELAALASSTKQAIQRVNFRVPTMSTGLLEKRRPDIWSGE